MATGNIDTRPAMRWCATLVVVLGATACLSIYAASDYARAAALVARAAGVGDGWIGRLARLYARSFVTSELQVQTRSGPIRARLYRPSRQSGRTTLLVPGVHALGIDEPRLTRFAGELAQSGMGVVTIELPDLLQYRITPRLTDQIEDAAGWVSHQPDLSPDGRVGLIGISFAGGLSVVAAGRPSVRNRLAFALSFGGHGDLPRVLRYLCTGEEPDGSRRPPHDYGVAVILLNAADHMVPPEEVDGLRRGILMFLHASHMTLVDKQRAEYEFSKARAMEDSLPSPAKELLHGANARDVERLGPLLLPQIAGFAGSDVLSPSRSPAPACPVYLLHGADDNVIPAIEARLLAGTLEGRCPVHLLITPLITHAEVDRRRRLGDIWRLVTFWERLMDE
ncbi:MAG: hypothetical protein AB1714_12960 [Acidobacteriota bacterium]